MSDPQSSGAADAPMTRRQAREQAAVAQTASSNRPETGSVPPILGGLRPATQRRSVVASQRSAKPVKVRAPKAAKSRAAKAGTAKPAKPVSTRPSKAPRTRGPKVKVRFAKAQKQRSSIGSRFLSLGALIGAAALLVGMSVPANAFIDVTNDGGLPTTVAQRVTGQSLAVSADAANTAPTRDGFEVISYAELLKLKYSGVSYAYTATSGEVRWPFPYPVPITDGFGYRNGDEMHNGVDFVPGNGTPIYAIADGLVTTAVELEYSFGNHVIVQHNLGGVNIQSLYAHMQSGSSPLQVGQEVKVGDFIGLVGETGRAYGAHLHFELHIDGVAVDPYAWLQANAIN